MRKLLARLLAPVLNTGRSLEFDDVDDEDTAAGGVPVPVAQAYWSQR